MLVPGLGCQVLVNVNGKWYSSDAKGLSGIKGLSLTRDYR